MKKIIVALAMLALVGCKSMADLRASTPNNTFRSNHDVNTLSLCILNGWQNNSVRYGEVFIQPLNNGKTVYSQGEQELVDIFANSNETTVKFYHQSGLFEYRVDSRINVLKSCI
jgi:hypothetical protein